MESFDTSGAVLFNKSDSLEVPVGIRRKAEHPNVFHIRHKWKDTTRYELTIPPGTFTDYHGHSHDSIKISFRTRERGFYGSLKLNLTLPDTSHTYLLRLKKNDRIVEERIADGGEKKWNFRHLHPGSYDLKLIRDRNRNRRWDPGHYLKGRQPESVWVYQKDVEVRSNWELDLSWTIGNGS